MNLFSYLYSFPRAFPAICFSPSLVVGRAFSCPGSISISVSLFFCQILKHYNKWKCCINKHIVKVLIQITRLGLLRKTSRCPGEKKKKDQKENGESVQSERAASTVTNQQQSNKSASALRNVNPCSAILRSRQRLEKKTSTKKGNI